MNAKKELSKHSEKENIRCAFISYYEYLGSSNSEELIILKDKHTQKDLNSFLKKLDFDYDSGYGLQFLYGTVWLKDGTWLERREYDGSEWWEHKVLPEIPAVCQHKEAIKD